MKQKRFLSCVLALALVFSLTGMSAAAAFPDVPADFWAVKYIDDMTAKGIFKGYENGQFRPANQLQAGEALGLCARISVEAELRAEIGKDRQEDIHNIFGATLGADGVWTGEQYWFANEYATCLEADILSYADLKTLYQTGQLTKPIAKEDFARYLVRAMQLGPMAENLATFDLKFTDKQAITPGYEPYIYLLNMNGIITGTENNEFQPKSFVNRAVASTMLSRSMDFMEKRGTSVELAEYADYDCEAGTISTATAGNKGIILLTLASDITGTKTISIPAETPIYENSMLVESSLLKPGTYARVCLDQKNVPVAVRLSGAVKTVSGSVVGVSKDTILLNVNGGAQQVTYDRFTEVQVGKKTGDRSLIDIDAGYTSAVCRLDQLGHLVAVQLTGGTRKEEGLVSSVENLAAGGATLVVSDFNGQLQRLSVPAGTPVTANGLTVSTFNTSYAGSYVALRVSNDNGAVTSAAVDTVTRYLQGAIKSTGSASGINNITIGDLVTGKATTYNLSAKPVLTYENVAVSYGALLKDWFVTIRLSGTEVDMVAAYPGSATTEGTITEITFPAGSTTEIISVTRADGTITPFEINLLEVPEILRGGKKSSIDKLRTGDKVTVTVRYHAVTRIESTAQTANLSGTIAEVGQTLSAVTIKVNLDNNGGTASYTITSGVSVTQDAKTISMFDLRAGYHVAMVANGDQVASVEVDRAASSTNQLTGTVIITNTTDKTITFRAMEANGQEKIVTVHAGYNTTLQQATGSSFSFSKLAAGDRLDIYGAYGADGVFEATLIVRK
ncbi:MAG: S-layer homology domain-containing protein [Pseudoflavonifractor sp.]